MTTKELIEKIFKEPGIKFELAEFERLGKPIHEILDIIARIESQVRLVTDSELVFLARSLDVPLETLFAPTVRKTLQHQG